MADHLKCLATGLAITAPIVALAALVKFAPYVAAALAALIFVYALGFMWRSA